MSLLRRSGSLFGLFVLVLSNSAHTDAIEVSAAGGFDWYAKYDASAIISSSETDRVKVNEGSLGGAWKVGVGYSFLEGEFCPYLHRLLVTLNLYQTTTTLSGAVWQFEQAQFYNYNFEAPIRSMRLMVDAKPSFFTWNSLEPYLIFGMGVAWNSVAYTETAVVGVNPASRLTLSEASTTQFALDLGAGVNFELIDNLSLNFEYIYAILGHGSPANDSGSVTLETPPSFLLQAHSFLLGANLKF